MNLSLHSRLLAVASVVLLFFFGLTGLVLDKAFRDSAESGVQERLQTHVYVLLAAAEIDAGIMLFMPDELPDPRFSVAQSGLYAQVIDHNGKSVWRSRSLLGADFPVSTPVDVGQSNFSRSRLADGSEVFVLGYGVSWQIKNTEQRYTFYVASSLESYLAEIKQFRRSLSVWLAAAALVLLALQGAILRWSLKPLRQAEQDLAAIESGEAETLTGTYPKELQGLTNNLNQLLVSSRAQLKRYRDSLGNLAHSLKTPLAVLRSTTEKETDVTAIRKTTQDQVDRMSQSIDYQLNRAAASGSMPLTAPVAVKPIAEKIVSALNKAHPERVVTVSLEINNDIRFFGNEDDLYEVLGNLLENAFKWCANKIQIAASNISVAGTGRKRLKLIIEDDGPGIAEVDRESVLGRGKRSDESVPGHGIGLSIVVEIVGLYGGEIRLDESPLGGAVIYIEF
ncbi:MAG: GHKL domain-containing protein [Acidiferrobacterales bacterium]|nr:GHKL domain-containing protein [Acidiferrobacterales bacterium]